MRATNLIKVARLKAGDRLVVWRVDRPGRSTLESLKTAKDLDERGVDIVITTLGIDLKTPVGRLVFGMMVQIAQFERELIRERVKAGMADAKTRGVHTGRKRTLRPHQRAEAARLHNEGQSLGKIAALLGCGRTVVHRAIHSEDPIRGSSPTLLLAVPAPGCSSGKGTRQRDRPELPVERSTGFRCDTIEAHDTIDSVCSVCFPGAKISAREAALRYNVERHSSMDALLADLPSDDK
jgi:hypothetical protein